MKGILRGMASEESGSSAVEFALLIPVTILVVFTIVQFGAVLFATANLHWSVEQAARCAATSQLNTNAPCGTTQATAVAYASRIYQGPPIGGTPTALDDTAHGCRQIAVPDAHYNVTMGPVQLNIPLSAQSCFPVLDNGTPWPGA